MSDALGELRQIAARARELHQVGADLSSQILDLHKRAAAPSREMALEALGKFDPDTASDEQKEHAKRLLTNLDREDEINRLRAKAEALGDEAQQLTLQRDELIVQLLEELSRR
jgi:hypothetical protein